MTGKRSVFRVCYHLNKLLEINSDKSDLESIRLPVYIIYNAVGFDFFMVLLFGITRLKS